MFSELSAHSFLIVAELVTRCPFIATSMWLFVFTLGFYFWLRRKKNWLAGQVTRSFSSFSVLNCSFSFRRDSKLFYLEILLVILKQGFIFLKEKFCCCWEAALSWNFSDWLERTADFNRRTQFPLLREQSTVLYWTCLKGFVYGSGFGLIGTHQIYLLIVIHYSGSFVSCL